MGVPRKKTSEWTLWVVAASAALHVTEEYFTGWQKWALETLDIVMPTPRFLLCPSYERCLNDAPQPRNHNGADRSQADFEFCLISIDRGWPVEATAQKLMRESEKAKQPGLKYAQHTARRAAELVKSKL